MAPTTREPVVLVAVDFSEPSKKALDHALALAARLGARIELLHVSERLRPLLSFSARNRAAVERIQRENFARAERCMRELLPGKPPVEIRTSVVSGEPSEEIVRRAQRLKADLIVLASHGHRPLEQLALGSVAERVLRRSTLPVVLVPRSAPKSRLRMVRR